MKRTKPLLVIGGMGPQASAEVHVRLVKKATQASKKQPGFEFPEIIILSLPVPDFISDRDRIDESFSMIIQETTKAMVFDPGIVMLACNTAHLLQEQLLHEIPGLPLVSLIDAVVETILAGGVRKIGLLTSPTTIQTKLYQNALAAVGVECVPPTTDELSTLERIIRDTIDGQGTKHKQTLDQLIDRRMSEGCDGVLLGCTELPVVFGDKSQPHVFDSISILCDRMMQEQTRNSDIMEAI